MKSQRWSLLILIACISISALIPRAWKPPIESPFSIGGIRLGMTVEQIRTLHEFTQDGDILYAEIPGDVLMVKLKDNIVIGVSGPVLEQNGKLCSPQTSHEDLPENLTTFLGQPDRRTPEKEEMSFVHSYWYDDYSLVIQFGCTGWYFILGQAQKTTAFQFLLVKSHSDKPDKAYLRK